MSRAHCQMLSLSSAVSWKSSGPTRCGCNNLPEYTILQGACHLGWRTLLKCNKTNHACRGRGEGRLCYYGLCFLGLEQIPCFVEAAGLPILPWCISSTPSGGFGFRKAPQPCVWCWQSFSKALTHCVLITVQLWVCLQSRNRLVPDGKNHLMTQ